MTSKDIDSLDQILEPIHGGCEILAETVASSCKAHVKAALLKWRDEAIRAELQNLLQNAKTPEEAGTKLQHRWVEFLELEGAE